MRKYDLLKDNFKKRKTQLFLHFINVSFYIVVFVHNCKLNSHWLGYNNEYHNRNILVVHSNIIFYTWWWVLFIPVCIVWNVVDLPVDSHWLCFEHTSLTPVSYTHLISHFYHSTRRVQNYSAKINTFYWEFNSSCYL